MRRREIAPAPPRRAGYPRLKAAWRLLLGAAPLAFPSLALADATVPPPGPAPQKSPVKPHAPPKPERVPRLMGDISVAEPPAAPIKAVKPPRVMVNGGPRWVEPPTPPVPQNPPNQKEETPAPCPKKTPTTTTFYLSPDGEQGIILHPHGPDEPCIRFELPAKRSV